MSDFDLNPEARAKAAGLRYVTDSEPGITRKRRGGGFTYQYADGRTVKDQATRERIADLVIPPAWTNVWICRTADGHLQATGRDDRGRKQYRYHPRWDEVRTITKFHHMIAFGEALPGIRAVTDEHLRKHGLPREKVLATAVQLLERTHIRVGNKQYYQQNGTFGLTTLRDRHVNFHGGKVDFCFIGKSGKERSITLADPRLARLVRRCRDIPGQELFQYLDEDGTRHPIDSGEVNDYIRDISGADFSSKDFRTWAGTCEAAVFLHLAGEAATKTALKKNITAAVKQAACVLGNRPATCRNHYIHPGVLSTYEAERRLQLALKPCNEDCDAELREKTRKAMLRFLHAWEKSRLKTAA